jgi:ribosomal protein S18 acetylase RimI-like enzyme
MDISSFCEKHLKDIYNLSNYAFGNNYHSESHYRSYIDSPGNIGIVAIDKKKVIGFLTLNIIDSKNRNDFFLTDFSWFLKEENNKNIAVIHQIVVHPNSQKQGIGNLLIQEANNKISNINCLCIAWKNKGKVDLNSVLTKNHFSAIKTIKNYWFKDSIQNNYSCPTCGHPCKCDAIVYIKKGLHFEDLL